MSWRDRAACLDMDTNLFFPEAGRNAYRQVERAKRICSTCPVRQECLDYALEFPDRSMPGIWGGTTEGERRRMRPYEIWL